MSHSELHGNFPDVSSPVINRINCNHKFFEHILSHIYIYIYIPAGGDE